MGTYLRMLPASVEAALWERMRTVGRFHGSEVRDLWIDAAHGRYAVDTHAEMWLREAAEAGYVVPLGRAPTVSQRAFTGLSITNKAYQGLPFGVMTAEHYWFMMLPRAIDHLKRETLRDDGIRCAAWISEDEVYRYALSRTWGDGPTLVYVMLNPSKADHLIDDHTITKCIEFARRRGCGGLVVVNLFALRSTDPEGLKTSADPIGPLNNEILRRVTAPEVVVAWGNHGDLMERDAAVLRLLEPAKLLCFGRTKSGQPMHPLTLSYKTPLVLYAAT